MLMSVNEFNANGKVKYQKAVDSFDMRKGGFPFYPMYVFKTPEGNDRKRGFVVSNGNSHHFYLNKKDLP